MNKTKKVKNLILLMIIIAFALAVIGGTYSRYTSTGTLRANATIAKWAIKLNNSNVTVANTSVDVIAAPIAGVSNENVSEGKIAPGQTLGGTIVVDPEGSEVAVDYFLKVNNIVAEGFNSNSELKISKVLVTVDGGETRQASYVNGKYMFSESLEDVLAGKKVSFEAQVNWVDGNNAADTANGTAITSVKIPVEVTAKQHLPNTYIALGEETGALTNETLQDRMLTIEPGDTVVLAENLTYDDYAEYPTSGHIPLNFPDNATLDLNGKTFTSPNGAFAYTGNDLTIKNGNFVGLISQYGGRYGIQVWNENNNCTEVSRNVVIENVSTTGICLYNAEVTLKNVVSTVPDDAKYYAVYGNVYSKITIESGTYTAGTNTTALLGYCSYDSTEVGKATTNGRNPEGGFVIKGGTFISGSKPLFLLNSTHVAPIIYGGTFDENVEDYVADGYECVDQGNGTWIVQPEVP